MSDISNAFLAGRKRAGETRTEQTKPDPFQIGVDWVKGVLKPAVEEADAALRPHGVSVRLDLNLDHSSTNHAHADFWLVQTQTASGQSYDGPKHSVNVVGRDVMLYRAGASGRSLGTTDTVGANEVKDLLRQAAEEYGTLFRAE
jgi:hypothetical protein